MSARPPAALPDRWRLANGLTVLFRQGADVPLAAATLIFSEGSAHEPVVKAGVAGFTMALLLEGTKRHSARTFAGLLETMGASIGADAAEDYADAGFISPSQHLPRVLGMLADALRTPAFSREEIVKEKAQTLASFRSRHDTLFNVSYDSFNETLYGKNHPYGRLVEGTLESVTRLTRHDCVAWHAQNLRPENTILSIVASQPVRTVRPWIEKYLGSWENESMKAVTLSNPFTKPQVASTIRLFSRFEQAYLMTGCRAPSTHDPHFLATKLFNIAVGGGMSSRLFMELREKRGLAYEVSSFFPTRLQSSQWVGYLGLPPEKLLEAKREMNQVLETVAEKGITRAELQQVKRMLKGAYWVEHQTRRRQAWYAAWWEFLGRDREYDRLYLEKIDAITLANVRDAGQALLSQPRVTIEVVPKK